jgi:MerR family transcriptional regulator, light-induced transcriptional regulator
MRHERFDQVYSTEARYNTKVVVRETGVPADTFRAWERRYGIPLPHRTGTGQRLYSERDIAVVRWLRDRTAEGMTISQAVRLLQNAEETPQPRGLLDPANWEQLQQQLFASLVDLDSITAEAVLGQAFARYSLDDVCLRLIEPVLVQIGTDWHEGRLSVGQEHFATAFLRRKLHSLLNVYDIVSGHATIVAAGAPGEQHDVGLLILALALVRRGYRVVYLGADVPLEGLLPVVEQVKPALVCLSATTMVSADQVPSIAAALRALENPPLVVVGGQAIARTPSETETYLTLQGNAIDGAAQIIALLSQQTSNE